MEPSFASRPDALDAPWYKGWGVPVGLILLVIGGARIIDAVGNARQAREFAQVRQAMAAGPADAWKLHVIVYSTSWCHVCKAAKAWLSKNEIPYEERDVETSRAYAAELHELNPGGGVPTMNVDGRVLVGFSEPQLARVLTEVAKKHTGT